METDWQLSPANYQEKTTTWEEKVVQTLKRRAMCGQLLNQNLRPENRSLIVSLREGNKNDVKFAFESHLHYNS